MDHRQVMNMQSVAELDGKSQHAVELQASGYIALWWLRQEK